MVDKIDLCQCLDDLRNYSKRDPLFMQSPYDYGIICGKFETVITLYRFNNIITEEEYKKLYNYCFKPWNKRNCFPKKIYDKFNRPDFYNFYKFSFQQQ